MRRTVTIAACALTLLGLTGCGDGGRSGGSSPNLSGSGSGPGNASDPGARPPAGSRPYYPGSLENTGAPPGKGGAD